MAQDLKVAAARGEIGDPAERLRRRSLGDPRVAEAFHDVLRDPDTDGGLAREAAETARRSHRTLTNLRAE